jgi:hypothetical protein
MPSSGQRFNTIGNTFEEFSAKRAIGEPAQSMLFSHKRKQEGSADDPDASKRTRYR